MIRITDFSELLTLMVADIQKTIPELKGFVLVANENHLVRRLSDKPGVWLGVTIPSSDPETVNEDSVAENNIVWIFILEKKDPGSLTATAELTHYQKLQDITTAVKNWLRDKKLDGNEFLEYLNLQSLHTDPEYQFGGWNGWSINFNFDTDGY
ncbi:MAG: hypothetical protein JZU47_11040 [Prolixibacteraceae bacterium]|nr:hypothetical protein [Prolixibacteraceae bacterium]